MLYRVRTGLGVRAHLDEIVVAGVAPRDVHDAPPASWRRARSRRTRSDVAGLSHRRHKWPRQHPGPAHRPRRPPRPTFLAASAPLLWGEGARPEREGVWTRFYAFEAKDDAIEIDACDVKVTTSGARRASRRYRSQASRVGRIARLPAALRARARAGTPPARPRKAQRAPTPAGLARAARSARRSRHRSPRPRRWRRGSPSRTPPLGRIGGGDAGRERPRRRYGLLRRGGPGRSAVAGESFVAEKTRGDSESGELVSLGVRNT